MESLNLLLPSIPVPLIVAFLAGVFFLHRAWGQSPLRTKILQDSPKTTTENITFRRPDQAKDESTAQTVSKESDFPANWWTGKGIFDLERRAVFSKTWLYVSHRSRFTKPGDYHSSELAGFPIFLMMGKDDKVRAFHNVCRHRAYTVTRREAGSSTVLGCKYHGWSYNTYGQLVKAPHFDNVPGFEKSENGLFEIHTRVSDTGFIFVNLDAGPVDSEVETGSLDSLASRNGVGAKSTWLGGQTLEGKFGWKLGLRLNQCLDATKLENRIYQSAGLSLATKLGGYFTKRKSEGVSVFPNASFHAVSNTELVYSLSIVPTSEENSLIRYDVFSSRVQDNANASDISEALKEFLNEGIEILEREYQCHVSRPDQPIPELAPEAGETQKQVLEKLKTHTKLEKTLGTEVYPAMRQPRKSQRFEQADKLCKDLDCFSGAMGGGGMKAGGEVLAW